MAEDPAPGSDKRQSWFPDFTSSSREVATKSVMSPLQWILAIVAATSLAGMIFVPSDLARIGFFTLFAADLIHTLFAYEHFKRSDPDRLQSESYRHAQSRLKQEETLLLDERNRGNMKIIDAEPVPNTHIQVAGSLSAATAAGATATGEAGLGEIK